MASESKKITKKSLKDKLVVYIRAGYSVIYLLTPKEVRAEEEILAAAKELDKRKVSVWSCSEGLSDDEDKTEPNEALKQILNAKDEKRIYIFRDLHQFMSNPIVSRQVEVSELKLINKG